MVGNGSSKEEVCVNLLRLACANRNLLIRSLMTATEPLHSYFSSGSVKPRFGYVAERRRKERARRERIEELKKATKEQQEEARKRRRRPKKRKSGELEIERE